MPAAPREALVIANRLPFPLDDGWKVRTFHVTRAVADLVPTVLAVGGRSSADQLRAAEAALGPGVRLASLPLPKPHTLPRLVAGLVSPYPVMYWNQRSWRGNRAIRELARAHQFDLVVAVGTFMWPLVKSLPGARLRVVDTHNIDSLNLSRYVATLPAGPRRAYAAITGRKLRRLERDVYSAADSVWVCSQSEAELAGSMAPSAHVKVVPNGVDTGAFAPSGPAPVALRKLLFFGRLDYYPNWEGLRAFCGETLPLIRRQAPDAELLVAGAGATPELSELLAATPGTRLLGRVEDIVAVLDQAALVVVPLNSGGGTRLKILEALSMARPVVSTTIGAEGLELRSGQEIALADTPEAFAREVVRLLEEPEAALRLGAAGRQAVLRRYDWQAIRATIREELEGRSARG